MSCEDIIDLSQGKLLGIYQSQGINIYGTVYTVRKDNELDKNVNVNCSLIKESTHLVLQNCKQIKNFILKRLFDEKYGIENVYLLVDFEQERNLYLVDDTSTSIVLNLEISIKCSLHQKVQVCDGPTLVWINEGKLALTSTYFNHLTEIDLSPSSVFHATSRYIFLHDNRQSLQLKIEFDWIDNSCCVRNLPMNSICMPEAYVEIISCFLAIFLNGVETFVVCTQNKQCLMFVDGFVVSFCDIPSPCVTKITLFEGDISAHSNILLQMQDSTVCALSFENNCSTVLSTFENVECFFCAVLDDGLERTILKRTNDLNVMLIADFTKYSFSALHKDTSHNADKQNNVSSAIKTIQSKILEMQMLENDFNDEMNEKYLMKLDIGLQISNLMAGHSDLMSVQNEALVSLFGHCDETQPTFRPVAEPVLALQIIEDSWKITHKHNGHLFCQLNIVNGSNSTINDIVTNSIITQSKSNVDIRFIKLPTLKPIHPPAKYQKLDESPNSLCPSERAVIGVKVPIEIFCQCSTELIISICWIVDDRVQQGSFKTAIDLLKISTGQYLLMHEDELFVWHLNLLNMFQFRADLCFESLHTNLNNIKSILSDCKEFSFVTKVTANLLFSQAVQYSEDNVFVSFKILDTSSTKAIITMYASSEKHIAISVNRLYRCHNFPRDIIVYSYICNDRQRKQHVLLTLKSELNYLINFFTKRLQSASSINDDSHQSSSKSNVIDNVRQSFKSKQKLVSDDIELTGVEYNHLSSNYHTMKCISENEILKFDCLLSTK